MFFYVPAYRLYWFKKRKRLVKWLLGIRGTKGKNQGKVLNYIKNIFFEKIQWTVKRKSFPKKRRLVNRIFKALFTFKLRAVNVLNMKAVVMEVFNLCGCEN